MCSAGRYHRSGSLASEVTVENDKEKYPKRKFMGRHPEKGPVK